MTTSNSASLDARLMMKAQELVHVGTWVWHVQTDTVQWSDELFRLFGVAPGSMPLSLGSYLQFVHPDDRNRTAGLIGNSLAEKRPFEFDNRIVTATGEVRVHHARGNVMCDETGKVTNLIGACIDITERKAQEERLAISEERFRSIFEQSGVGMSVADRDKNLIRVNASLAQFLGYDPRELIGRSFLALTHPNDVEMSENLLRQAEQDRSSRTYEKRYVRKDGAVVWARTTVTRLRNDDGTLDGYMGVVEDITERRAATEALQWQKQLLESILDHLPVSVSMAGPDGKILYINKECQRVFGWTLAEAQTIDILGACYPDPAERERVRRTIGQGNGLWGDFEPLTRDGRRVPMSWASINLMDGTSVAIGQDMSERKQFQERLLQAQKMEALGQLAGGVAHDFNNLLTVISASATFVLEDIGPDSESADDIREILSASNRAEALTRQLLAFSRRQMLKPEIVDVNTSIQSMAKTLGRLIPERITLSIVPAATEATVRVDAHQLEQVILNLVVNAKDAIQERGTITVETRNVSDPQYGGPQVLISVADDGVGMDAKVREHIFEPFFTTKPVGKGTGLGLATVHGIVEQSGGRIVVHSTPGKGSVFNIYLPRCVDAQTQPVVSTVLEPVGGGETVLLVEDESALRAAARRMLTSLGYTVLEARHGADALTLSRNHAGPIDLLVTDVVMPEVGGRELARLMRQLRPDIRVLYISGYTDDELLRKGIIEAGAQLLRKPFLPSDLAQSVRDLLRTRASAA